MTTEIIVSELNLLPEHLKIQVVNYIRFLQSPFAIPAPMPAKMPKFGFGKYKIVMRADFDEPLEDFKDYM